MHPVNVSRAHRLPNEELRTQLRLSVGGRSKFWKMFAPKRFENGLGAVSGPLFVPYCAGNPVDCCGMGSLSKFAIDAGYR